MRYRLIGIDLDGTLLNDDGDVSAENREAIARAQAAGTMVVPCTGRAWHEAKLAIDGVPNLGLGVFITGAVVADVATGNSVDLALIEPHVAMEILDVLRHEPEAVLVFRESSKAGHHYLVCGEGELTGNTQWWFEVSGATVHFQKRPGLEDLHHTLRVGMVGEESRMRAMEEKVAAAMGGRVQVHSFAALKRHDAESLMVLEVFAADAHKWRGLSWIAHQHGIGPEEVATIGDQVNDVAMLRNAGCGIAMGDGAEVAKAAAKRVTLGNNEHGVAHAIEQMLSGAW